MKVQYVSGSRADFGLMRSTLQALANEPGIDLSLALTGQALIARYGDVESEILDAGLTIAHRIPVSLSGESGEEMALAFADELRGLARAWSAEPPDLALVLGDRGEMLAAAIAAHHLGIAIAHIHGGELSGTLDDGFRHAISKLAQLHLVASEDASERLVKMGEWPESIHVVGAPGLVGLSEVQAAGRSALAAEFGVPADGPLALMLFHPVVQESASAFHQTKTTLAALDRAGVSALILRPNSDAGGAQIDRCLRDQPQRSRLVVLDHLPRRRFLEVLAGADFLIGNSSCGIIESASLGTACVNLGSRQDGRMRNDNTLDVPQFEVAAIQAAIERALALGGPFDNRYGDGAADRRIAGLLGAFRPTHEMLQKRNRY